jgi:ribonuclease P protein component
VGNAVARNRVKRAVREWFRKERCQLEPDIDLVVIARREATKLGAGEVAEVLRELTSLASKKREE